MQALNVITAFTLGALALYFFVGRADESAKFIDALSKGYERGVGVFTNVR